MKEFRLLIDSSDNCKEYFSVSSNAVNAPYKIPLIIILFLKNKQHLYSVLH